MLQIRKATEADSRAVWEWRNDPVTRAMFRNSAEVLWEDHEAWYSKMMISPGHLLLIGWREQERVGVVRFDRLEEAHTVEISVNLNPQFRGQGLSKPLLKGAIEEGGRSWGFQRVRAEVKKGNEPSNRLFLSVGFAFEGEESEMNLYSLDMIRSPADA